MEISTTDLLNRIKSIAPLKSLVTDLNIPQSTIATWKQKNVFPRSDDLYRIAAYLHVSMEWLLTGKDNPELSDQEKILIENYRKLANEDKITIEKLINKLKGIQPE